MSSVNVYVIGDPDQNPTRLSSKSESPYNNNNNVTSPLYLRANFPAKIISQGQLTAFIRNESNDGGGGGGGLGNADELYYEATLKLISPNDEEFSIGKLSKTNKCLHWEGEIDSSDGVYVVEADWREFRMHAISKTEAKENCTSFTTPKASKTSSTASHLKRKRSPLTVKDGQQPNDDSTSGSNEDKSSANSTTSSSSSSTTTTTPSSKKSKPAANNNNNSKAATLMSPASRKVSKPSGSTPLTPTSSKLAKLFHNQASKKAVEEVRESSSSSTTTKTMTTTTDATPKVYNPNTASGTFLNMLLAAKDDDDYDDASENSVEPAKKPEKMLEKSKEKKSKKKLGLKNESAPTISSTSSSTRGPTSSSATSSSATFLVQALLQDDDEKKPKSRDNQDDDDDEFELISTGVLEPSPSVRWGHSQCLVTSPSGNHVVVIGGQSVKSSFCRDATWLYDPSFGEWEALETGGSGGVSSPGMRMGHSSVFDPEKNSIFVYGGSKNCRWFKDMHMLSLDAGGWQELKTTGEAPTRAYHSAILHRNEIWIFGGVFPNPGTLPDGCSNSIEVYSSETGGWYSPEVTGTTPLPRSGHSASLLGDKMLIFGGWDMPAIFNDVHVFDLTFAEWTSPSDVQGSPPPARCWHASALITHPHPRLFIHGGFNGDRPLADCWVLDLPAGLSNSPSVTAKPQWTKVSLPDVNLNARAGHSAVSVVVKTEDDDDEADDEERIVLFGGGNNSGNFFNTTTVIRVPTRVNL